MSETKTALPLLIVVAAALVDAHGRILVQQRPPGKSMAGLWEFPGGKLEPGETPEDALVRELAEEIGVAINPADLRALTFASAPVGAGHLLMPLYLVRRWQGTPRAIEASAIVWQRPEQLRTLPMPPADVPLIDTLAWALERGGE